MSKMSSAFEHNTTEAQRIVKENVNKGLNENDERQNEMTKGTLTSTRKRCVSKARRHQNSNVAAVGVYRIGNELRTYYDVLNVPINASESEVKRAYYSLCKIYHPDKSSGNEDIAKLCSIQQAYNVLIDETKRLLYDIQMGVYRGADKHAKLQDLCQIQRQRTTRAIENMKILYRQKLKEEKQRNGLIIRKAIYGNLRLKSFLLRENYLGAVREEQLEGPFLDVTIPLQCQVDRSRFIFTGGPGSPMELLDGFYNPAPPIKGLDACLYILYEFQETLHEVTFVDKAYVVIPLKAHRISSGTPIGPFAPSNFSKLKADGSRSYGILKEVHSNTSTSIFQKVVWAAVITWSGTWIYTNYYKQEYIANIIAKVFGERISNSFGKVLPPTLSASRQQLWNKCLLFHVFPNGISLSNIISKISHGNSSA